MTEEHEAAAHEASPPQVSPPRCVSALPPPALIFPDLTRDDVFRLETRRLWLRWQRHADAPQLKAFAGRKEVADMTGTWPHPLPDGEVERRIFESRKANATGASLILAMTPRGKPNLQIGSIAVAPARAGAVAGQLTLGYMLHPDHWGQGLVVEAAQALIDATFRYTATEAVTADIRVINAASRRVLEKCGFRHEGSAMKLLPARGGMVPLDLFTLERKTWEALSQWGRAGAGRPTALDNAAPSPA
jgi:RimJ/RimL family protein N-acetyltransferase